jgi:hypothetical protein
MSAHGITRGGYGSANAFQPFNVPLIIDRHRLFSELEDRPSFYRITVRPTTDLNRIPSAAAGPREALAVISRVLGAGPQGGQRKSDHPDHSTEGRVSSNESR